MYNEREADVSILVFKSLQRKIVSYCLAKNWDFVNSSINKCFLSFVYEFILILRYSFYFKNIFSFFLIVECCLTIWFFLIMSLIIVLYSNTVVPENNLLIQCSQKKSFWYSGLPKKICYSGPKFFFEILVLQNKTKNNKVVPKKIFWYSGPEILFFIQWFPKNLFIQ